LPSGLGDDVRLAQARTAAEQQTLMKWKTHLETELQKQLDMLRQADTTFHDPTNNFE
jgi:plasmid maintenance system killer protein